MRRRQKCMGRRKFLISIIVLMILFLSLSIAIHANYYSQIVMWALFAYIIAKEVSDEVSVQRRRNRCFRFPVTLQFNNIKIKCELMEVDLHLDEVLPFRKGSPVNAEGGPANVQDGSTVLKSSDETIFTIEQDDQNPTDPDALIIVPHAVGKADLTETADADLGDGVETISQTATISVLAEGAVGFSGFAFGVPRKKVVQQSVQG